MNEWCDLVMSRLDRLERCVLELSENIEKIGMMLSNNRLVISYEIDSTLSELRKERGK